MAKNILVALFSLAFLVTILVLTNYPTYKILNGNQDMKKLIALTFSLPSIIFSILFFLYIGIIFIVPDILRIILLVIFFPLSWIFYYVSKIFEKFYC